MQLPSFANIRVTLLLLALLCFGFISLTQMIYTRSWNQTLEVTVFPMNADGHLSTADYIKSLSTDTFSTIDKWAEREARRHDVDLQTPFKVSLGEQIRNLPPAFPENANPVSVVFWGLRFRWWAYRNTPDDGGDITRIRMFVLYHSGADDKPLSHSLGMQKGLMGLVNAYSTHDQTSQNNVVIAHEMLHTVGAIDKYTEFGTPMYPVGFADPSKYPLFPQRYAEIMAGQVPTDNGQSYMAESLRSVKVNEFTALEINWIE